MFECVSVTRPVSVMSRSVDAHFNFLSARGCLQMNKGVLHVSNGRGRRSGRLQCHVFCFFVMLEPSGPGLHPDVLWNLWRPYLVFLFPHVCLELFFTSVPTFERSPVEPNAATLAVVAISSLERRFHPDVCVRALRGGKLLLVSVCYRRHNLQASFKK